MPLALVTKIRVDLLGFAHQVRYMSFGGLDQSRHLPHLICELASEFALLLVAPCLFQLIHSGGQSGALLPHFFGEPMQLASELT